MKFNNLRYDGFIFSKINIQNIKMTQCDIEAYEFLGYM